MPAPLPEENTKVCWRIQSSDLDLLRALFPGRVNEVVRTIIGVYCERVRSGQKSVQNQRPSEGV